MLFDLPIILSGNSFFLNLPVISKIIPGIYAKTSVLEFYISDCYIRIIVSKLTALLEYR